MVYFRIIDSLIFSSLPQVLETVPRDIKTIVHDIHTVVRKYFLCRVLILEKVTIVYRVKSVQEMLRVL